MNGPADGAGERWIAVAIVLTLLVVVGATLGWRATPSTEPPTLVVERPGDVLERHAYRMVRIVPGPFLQGAAEGDPDRMDDEVRRAVQLTRPYALGATEVTGALYAEVMGADPSSRPCDGCPVTDVSWLDAARFCTRLSIREGLRPAYRIDDDTVHWDRTAPGYRLPTEAEWEHAALAGEATRFAGADVPDTVAWFADNSDGSPQPVGRKRANALGLHDLSGNVWEWVWDPYGTWSSATATDPEGPPTGDLRVGKGGAWNTWGDMARIAARSRGGPASRGDVLGFRLARTTE
ncbi:MAG: sulfatase modifying factor 1 [Myxococcota bacterium]